MINDKVGIYIPTYNRAQFIGKTIDSILKQTYSNFILTIVDNASTDDTEGVVNSFEDERIKYIRNEKNIGAIKNINKCFELAMKNNENYIAIYHSDDEYINSIVEKELDCLYNNDKIKIVFTKHITIDEKGNIVGNNKNEVIKDTIVLDYNKLLLMNLKEGTPLVCPTFMCKKEVLEPNNQFDEKYKYSADTEYYLRLSRKFNIGILGEALIKYRISNVQETQIQYKEKGITEEFIVLNNEMSYYQREFGEIPYNIMTPYKKRLAMEYLRNAIDLIVIDYKGHSKEINEFVSKSISNFKYPLTSINGIKQTMLKNRMYFFYKVLKKL